MISSKMKDIHHVKCRKKTEKENKILVCIVIIEKCIVIIKIYCNNYRNVL